jgi:hypothetical protein
MNDIQKIKEFFSKPLEEAKTGVDMAKKRLDQLGVKYEMSKTDKVRPFKVIYKPINKSDRWYDEFEDIVDLFNLKGFVKTSMDEAKFMSGMLSGKDFINAKLKNYPKAVAKVNQLIDMIGESKFTMEMAEWIFDFFNNASFESPVNEASKEEETKFHKKLDKLVHSTFGKRKGELEEEVDQRNADSYAYQFMQYFDKMRGIVRHNFGDDTRKEFEKLVQYKLSKHIVNEGNLGHAEIKNIEKNLSPAQKEELAKLIKSGKIKTSKDLKNWQLSKKESVNEEELTEANVPSNIAEFAKRKGVSSLVRKVAGWAEKVGAGIRGGTAIGKDYSTLILDMTYQGSEIRINTDNDTVTLYDEPVNSFNQFQRVYLENKEENNGLEERIHEALNKINEELCPAGKAYIKKRKAAGEKSSAYLSGRAVKVCKGQMSGKAKKK